MTPKSLLWFMLVAIKLSVLWSVDVNFWWWHHLWLLPCAAIGHIVGFKLHDHLMAGDATRFKQVIGGVLVLICVLGLSVQLELFA